MKARVKATGEIVNVTHVGTKYYLYDLNNVEILNEPDCWEKLKHQAAIAAIQGVLANNELWQGIMRGIYPPERPKYLAKEVNKYAIELVNKLKEEEKS